MLGYVFHHVTLHHLIHIVIFNAHIFTNVTQINLKNENFERTHCM